MNQEKDKQGILLSPVINLQALDSVFVGRILVIVLSSHSKRLVGVRGTAQTTHSEEQTYINLTTK